jgi:enamine deaminase RidA (YjgF/YER057c/UK114 family)
MGIIRHHIGKRMSEVAIFNGVVYLAGQVARDASGDIVLQTKDVLEQIDTLLHQAKSDKARILMCQIFLSDLSNFEKMNTVWDDWVVPGSTPPRATIEAKLAKPEWLIEIVVTAAQAKTVE